ncbi:hypothetical protein LWP59_24995 [Amycolatopsis acidiphila]|uniref:hypothetical protein n=1 Tax=Amycolatopsis acidiphila TaxID=715473 RepID=UPI001643BD84|nr:hypothetical protein [Amycolatopsis acidiphila]UIJ57399.1 hypothetical protein LWP59_24995 [Amycolatopsis acidiphila]
MFTSARVAVLVEEITRPSSVGVLRAGDPVQIDESARRAAGRGHEVEGATA